MRDRSYGPAVLLGLGGAVLAAVASGRDWASSRGDAAGVEVSAAVAGSDTAPLALALSLVALAAWGALLVLRGRARRLVAVLGALAAAGVLATVVGRFGAAQDDAREAVVAAGATGDAFVSSLTGWYWAAGVGALLTLAALVVAVVRAPGWPAMGSRYDAPAARREQRESQPTEQDLWRALDEGHDPTA
ncbi:MAG TPA: Trp biosynthesis-associated membrane protein [Nocardioides sp.]|nr:Trp biosynthesis-associated membrane protein [Nocardioides sp.]